MRFGVSYFGVRNPEHMKRDLDDMAGLGFDYVVLTYSENDHQFYKESMARCVEWAQARGLTVWIAPWGVGGVFGGEAFSAQGAWQLEAQQVRSDGRSLPLLCPRSEELRGYLREWVLTVATELKADTIFWDEPHYYLPEATAAPHHQWSCRCRRCQDAFASVYGIALPDRETEEVLGWKQENIASLIDDVTATSAQYGLSNCVCVLPDYDHLESLESRLNRFAQNPNLDMLSTDPYPLMHGQPVDSTTWFCDTLLNVSRRHDTAAQMWVQGFQVPAGHEADIGREVELMASHGIDNIAIWSYLATSYMSSHRCADSDRVWSQFTQTMKRIRSR